MRSAKEITESLEIAKGLCEGKTNESWNARKAGRVMAELIAHFKKKEIEEQYDRVQIIATVVISKEDIDDIMVSALEGGITYWVDKVEPSIVLSGYVKTKDFRLQAKIQQERLGN